jgi:hypothetical protein
VICERLFNLFSDGLALYSRGLPLGIFSRQLLFPLEILSIKVSFISFNARLAVLISFLSYFIMLKFTVFLIIELLGSSYIRELTVKK